MYRLIDIPIQRLVSFQGGLPIVSLDGSSYIPVAGLYNSFTTNSLTSITSQSVTPFSLTFTPSSTTTDLLYLDLTSVTACPAPPIVSLSLSFSNTSVDYVCFESWVELFGSCGTYYIAKSAARGADCLPGGTSVTYFSYVLDNAVLYYIGGTDCESCSGDVSFRLWLKVYSLPSSSVTIQVSATMEAIDAWALF